MCGIAASSRGPRPDEATAGGDDRRRPPPRSRRHRLYRDDGAALGHARLSIIDSPAAPSRCATRTARSGSSSTARSSTTSSCAPSCAAAVTASGPRATPRSSSMPTRSGARLLRPLQRPLAFALWDRRDSGWSWRATGWACARCSSRGPAADCSSPPRSRRCSPIRRCRGRSTRRPRPDLHLLVAVAPRTVFERSRAVAARALASTTGGVTIGPLLASEFPARGHEAGQDLDESGRVCASG